MSYVDIQNRLLEGSIIERIDLESVTPVRIGGYNAQPYSSKLDLLESIRAQSIKGVWRWWARALISGVLIGLGKSPPDGISELSSLFLDPLLGSTKSASKITILLNLQDDSVSQQLGFRDLTFIPRIRLIGIGKRDEENKNEVYPSSLKFSIELIKRCEISHVEEKFAYSSLVLAFLLGGLGSIVNRGFGRFKVSISKHQEDQRDLDRLYSSKNQNEVTERLRSIIEKFAGYAREYLEGECSQELNKLKPWIKGALPPYPSIVTWGPAQSSFRCEAVLITDNWRNALQCIGDATLKAKWKANHRESGMSYHTWILGLPRLQARTQKGYKFEYNKAVRRQSAIGFSVLKLTGSGYHKSPYSIVMYGFLTNDWVKVAKSLQHVGISQKRIIELPIRFPEAEKRASSPDEHVKLVFEAAWKHARIVILKKSMCRGGDTRVS
ncbi:MAG: type III-B CRISPR module RAMP protein Cmr1 [Candidatus Bathyarchaeia archaeon]|uniref:type III-B CRISPR module RAMP protein Cmr1 n=1 Tax=Thermofilum sp. TaxID=1961369 RepID=UPI00316824A4